VYRSAGVIQGTRGRSSIRVQGCRITTEVQVCKSNTDVQ
jgi:hypothetical protein